METEWLPNMNSITYPRRWWNMDPEPRVRGVWLKAKKKNCDLHRFDGGSGQ